MLQATALENLLESDSDEEDDGYKIQTRERNREQREILKRRRERGRRRKKEYPSFEEGEVGEVGEVGEGRRRNSTTRESIQSCSSIDSDATFGEHHSRYPLADDEVSGESEYESESESDDEGGRRSSSRRRRRRRTTTTTKKDPFVTTVTGGDIDQGRDFIIVFSNLLSTK